MCLTLYMYTYKALSTTKNRAGNHKLHITSIDNHNINSNQSYYHNITLHFLVQ